MRYQDIIFTVSPVGGNLSVKMCYTCRSPEELMCAKEAIIDYLDTMGEKWDKEEHRCTVPAAPVTVVEKEKVQQAIDYALNQVKALGTHGQYNFTEGLIKMARLAGVITEGDFLDVMEYLESLKGYCDYQNDLKQAAKPVSREEATRADKK